MWTWPKGSGSGSSRPRPISISTSITSRSTPRSPDETAAAYEQLGFGSSSREPRARRVSRSAAPTWSSTGATRSRAERPLLNHLAVLVDSAEEHIAAANELRDRGRRRRRRAEHLRGLPLGSRPREGRVRRAQAELLARLSRPDLIVAGAGLAGLVAAVRARELGASVVVHEKGDRPGGSMRLSSGVVWRYREWERFRDECPAGDPVLAATRSRRARRGARVARGARRSGGRHARPETSSPPASASSPRD